MHAVAVSNGAIRAHAERLVAGPVDRGELALGFSESRASDAEALVEGRTFFPRMLEDIAAASSSVHINQFGFRPGAVGEEFAEALVGKAAEGLRCGSSSTGRARIPRGLARALRA